MHVQEKHAQQWYKVLYKYEVLVSDIVRSHMLDALLIGMQLVIIMAQVM